jgi:putative endopeptidase
LRAWPTIGLTAFVFVLALTVSARPTASSSVSHRVDVAGMDRKVLPGDDFYSYANGAWMQATEIPADRASFGAFTILDEQIATRLRELLEANGQAGSSGALAGAFYAAYMDEAAIEKRGLSPVKPELDAIAKIADRRDLARVLGGQLRADVDALNRAQFHTDRLFGLWAAPDFAEPGRYVAYLMQGGLGLPDRDYYRNTDAKSVEIQNGYRAHIAAVLRLAGISDPEAKAGRIYGLEKRIAGVHASRTESVDVHRANNPWRPSEFPSRAPGLDWKTWFEAAGLSGQPKIMVWQADGAKGIAALAGSEPLETWKEYLAFRALDRSSALLPRAFAEEQFRFYETALTGAQKPRDRWKRAVAATSASLGDAVGRLYVGKYFPPEAKAQAQAMVANIVAAFRRRIDALDWMAPATRATAKAKLETLYVGIGYPEHWRSYEGLRIEKDDALGNFERTELFDYRAALAKLGRAVDKTEWAMSPQTVNAVNLPLQNAMNFPAAVLNPPFFDATGDPVQNYGAIGAVIGHEISHSFDDQGSQFDETGALRNWWTPQDLAHFQAAAARLVAQYDAYEPLPGLHVNGQLTLSENIADVAGVSAAFDGYRSAVAAEAPKLVEGFSADQRFFVAYAQAWRRKSRPEQVRRQVLTDGHSPGPFRADCVRNLDPWYAAFEVRPGQALYLEPSARVRVW